MGRDCIEVSGDKEKSSAPPPPITHCAPATTFMQLITTSLDQESWLTMGKSVHTDLPQSLNTHQLKQ